MVMCLTFAQQNLNWNYNGVNVEGWMGEEKFLTVQEHGHLEHALVRKEADLVIYPHENS